jgi:hypothetical protein
VRDSKNKVELLLIDMDSTCCHREFLPPGLEEHLKRSPWKNAYFQGLRAGQRPPTAADWYMMLAVVKLSKWAWRGNSLEELKEQLQGNRSDLESMAKELASYLDNAAVPLADAVHRMLDRVSPLKSPPKAN